MTDSPKKIILLVEDEAIIAITQKAALEYYGYAVIWVNSGEKAVEAIKNTSGIHLILMDIDLGKGIDGTEAAALILKDRDIPVVFCSSHTEQEVVAKTEKITSYGYVVKSSSNTVLDASIKMAFKLFEANMQIKLAKEKLEATLDALPDLLFELGPDGFCHDCHSPHSELLVTPVQTIIGRNIQELLPAEISAVVLFAIREAHKKGTSTGQQYQMTVPAGTFWFELSVSRKGSDQDEPRFIVLRRDVTERKKIEENLRAHQIELQMQNEELRKKQADFETLRQWYFDLYDMAPVAYFTLYEAGVIVEANLAAASLLGEVRSRLVKQAFGSFIFPADQDSYYLRRKALLETGESQSCKLRMLRKDGSDFSVFLKMLTAQDDTGTAVCRVVVVDLGTVCD